LIVVAPDEKKVEVAVVSLAFKFVKEFLRALVVPLTGIQTPLFARLYAEGRIEGLRTTYATMTKFLVLALLPASVGLIVVGRNVLQVFYKQIGRDAVLTQFTMPEAVACMAILTVGLFGEAIISVALNVLMVYEEYRAVIVARLFALVSIPLLVLLVPSLGVVGAAIAAAVAGVGSRIIALVYAVRHLHLVFPGEFFGRVGFASLLMGYALLPLLLLPVTPIVTVGMIALGALIFYGAFKLLGGMDAADKERFGSLRIPFAGLVLRFL
jgi:O-antigen/teichoic acid export membrane protein